MAWNHNNSIALLQWIHQAKETLKKNINKKWTTIAHSKVVNYFLQWILQEAPDFDCDCDCYKMDFISVPLILK